MDLVCIVLLMMLAKCQPSVLVRRWEVLSKTKLSRVWHHLDAAIRERDRTCRDGFTAEQLTALCCSAHTGLAHIYCSLARNAGCTGTQGALCHLKGLCSCVCTCMYVFTECSDV